MKSVTLSLPWEVVLFYGRIAGSLGISLEQVLSDALFRLAGELALESMGNFHSDL